MPYNYSRFTPDVLTPNGFPGPKAGEPFLDARLRTLEGDEVQLSEWVQGPTVIETGSLSSPSFLRNLPEMNRCAREFAHVTFLVLYVREAFPGSKRGAHGTFDEKLAAAKVLRDRLGETRTILVDDLEGTVHQEYGALPNMLYMINPDGVVFCRSTWANPVQVRKVLLALEDDKTALVRREHQAPNLAPLPGFFAVAGQAGWGAAMDMIRGVGVMKQHSKRARHSG